MTEIPVLLQVDDLHVRYADGIDALRGLSLRLHSGERVGLIGPNGSGKTTLMLAIMHAVRFCGRIVVDTIEVNQQTEHAARSRCGMIFQDAEDHLFMPTLLDDVAFGPLNQGCDADEAQRRAGEAIAQVGLTGLEHRSAHHMSGGQKRVAALATVLSMQVKLLLLDEPGANLDGRSRRRLIDILDGRTEALLLATHDLPMIRRLCSRVILLDQGQILADRPTASLLADTALLSAHGLVDDSAGAPRT
ncbi:MAG: ABC transporter ATP-binding protein [Planctomycetota bacterium]|nr:ABC transporter ATP-binding protein [Planctomycetota bacterium]